MAYLHPQVVHRDLKSQNVVFGNNKAKVCDFGIAKFKERYDAKPVHSCDCSCLEEQLKDVAHWLLCVNVQGA